MPPPSLRAPLEVQILEDRCLPTASVTAILSATLTNGLLSIVGTNGNDTIMVRQINTMISVDGIKIQAGANLYPAVSIGQVKQIQIQGLNGNDVIHVDTGGIQGQQPVTLPTIVTLGSGNDQVWGSAGNCTLQGGAGNDTLFAGNGNDVLNAGTGNSSLVGGTGNDTLSGGSGQDTLFGNTAHDVLQGGTGFTTYHEAFDLSEWFSRAESVTDIRQNQAPTCQTLAALAAGIEAGVDFSKQIIHQGGASFDVRLTLNGNLVTVPVQFNGTWNDNDPQPPVDANGRTLNDYWTILMQRARMTLLGVDTSHAMTAAQWSQDDANTGYLLTSVGNAMYTLTGQMTHMNFVTSVTPQSLSTILSNKGMAVASTFTDPTQLSPNTGLVPLHAYTLIRVYQQGGTWMVEAYNPWGIDGIGPPVDGVNDGFITLTWAEFSQSFQYVNTVA